MISKYIDKLREGESLQSDEAEHCLSSILESNLPDNRSQNCSYLFYSTKPPNRFWTWFV